MNPGGLDEVMRLDEIEKKIATLLVFQKVKKQDDEDSNDKSEKNPEAQREMEVSE